MLKDVWVLQCDISKFFANVDHQILMNILRRRIADKALLDLLDIIVLSHQDAPGRGIPIGNLTSQLFANVYLNELDQFVKHVLRERYYLRYMDDFIIVGTDKRHLQAVLRHVEDFLQAELRLQVHPRKATVRPARVGVDFLGYVLVGTHRRLRTSSVRRFVRRTRRQQCLIAEGSLEPEKMVQAVQSWNAYAQHASSYCLRQKLYKDLKINQPKTCISTLDTRVPN